MPAWLSKEYGPFTGTVWVVVIVGGVGLGFLMRRYMGRDTPEGSSSNVTTDPGFTGTNPTTGSGAAQYNQGAVVSDVLAALRAQQREGAGDGGSGTNPGNVSGGGSHPGGPEDPMGRSTGGGGPMGPGSPPGADVKTPASKGVTVTQPKTPTTAPPTTVKKIAQPSRPNRTVFKKGTGL